MRLFFRTTLTPDLVLEQADAFFVVLGLARTRQAQRARSFAGGLGKMELSVRMEGGHYTVVEVSTDQVGESRLDRNVKKFFVGLKRVADPARRMEAAY